MHAMRRDWVNIKKKLCTHYMHASHFWNGCVKQLVYIKKFLFFWFNILSNQSKIKLENSCINQLESIVNVIY